MTFEQLSSYQIWHNFTSARPCPNVEKNIYWKVSRMFHATRMEKWLNIYHGHWNMHCGSTIPIWSENKILHGLPKRGKIVMLGLYFDPFPLAMMMYVDIFCKWKIAALSAWVCKPSLQEHWLLNGYRLEITVKRIGFQ